MKETKTKPKKTKNKTKDTSLPALPSSTFWLQAQKEFQEQILEISDSDKNVAL